MQILAVGIATLDIVNRVADYPDENREVRTLGQRVIRGGNATNTLTVLSRLGHNCHWAGVVAVDSGSQLIRNDLAGSGIDTRFVRTQPDGSTPTSYITLSDATGSRTIVHHRNLDEFSAEDFESIDLAPFDWIHFEGRDPGQIGPMMRRVNLAGIGCSLEVEKVRPGMDRLFSMAQLLFFSRDYVLSQGVGDATQFLEGLRDLSPRPGLVTCAWGEQGAWGIDDGGVIHSAPAHVPRRVVDTLGAGDLFNAVVIDGHLNGLSPGQILNRACQMAGEKCGREGL